MLSHVLILCAAFIGPAWTVKICPLSVDAETSEIKINASAFPNFGRRGLPGPIGLVGPTGEKGEAGRLGKPGYNGIVGPEGPKGDKGEAGPAGGKGDIGRSGRNGGKGDAGQKGDVGPRGIPGRDGVSPPNYEKRIRELEEAMAYVGKSWRTIGRYRIWFSEVKMNYHAAEKLCKSKGSRLAAKSIRDTNSRKEIFEIVKDKNAQCWIGLNDIHREGRFVWSDGVTFNQPFLWRRGEPSNSGNEDCAVVISNAAGISALNDITCSVPYGRVICEKDA